MTGHLLHNGLAQTSELISIQAGGTDVTPYSTVAIFQVPQDEEHLFRRSLSGHIGFHRFTGSDLTRIVRVSFRTTCIRSIFILPVVLTHPGESVVLGNAEQQSRNDPGTVLATMAMIEGGQHSLIGILISKKPECNQEDLENQASEKRHKQNE